MTTKVEKRMALILPVFIFDRLTFDTPTVSDSSLGLIFLPAMTRSRRSTIAHILFIRRDIGVFYQIVVHRYRAYQSLFDKQVYPAPLFLFDLQLYSLVLGSVKPDEI